MRLIDLTGREFGLLKVTGKAPSRYKKTFWKVWCCCGKRFEIDGRYLKAGRMSCNSPTCKKLSKSKKFALNNSQQANDEG